MTQLNRLLSIAPMLHHTDRHFRYLMRLISANALLYTEMVVDHAILKGAREHLLQYNPAEHPVAVQLGGSNPDELTQCALICEEYGYDEINLNVGCPSHQVISGHFGACLMAEPKLVAECVAAMQNRVKIPVTVKTRIGIDRQDSYEFLHHFVTCLDQAGCKTLIIHARKAWLTGLNPKQNRTLPPLEYERAYHLKKDFPHLEIIINGGIQKLDEIKQHLRKVDGVMIGREAYHNPLFITELDAALFGGVARLPAEILAKYMDYIAQQLKNDVPFSQMARHLLGFYHGIPGAKAWRSYLSQNMHGPDAGLDVLRHALDKMV